MTPANLSTIDEKLLAEWDYQKNIGINPSVIKPKSSKKFWWKCHRCGSSWLASPAKRADGRGCSYCAGKAVNETNSLAALFPTVAKEWHPNLNEPHTPETVTAKNSKKVWWKCLECSHEWEASISNRTDRNSRCPKCSKRQRSETVPLAKVAKSGNSISATLGHLVDEWDYEKNSPITPETISARSSTKVWWKCDRGHSWQARPGDRFMGTGCPECQFGWQTSRVEVRIFSELAQLFEGLQWRHKIDRTEIDFFIPSIGVGIEIDGYFWHKDKLLLDTAKNKVAEKKGFTLIRIREKRLNKISEEDVVLNFGDHKKVVFELCSKIIPHVLHNSVLCDKIQKYIRSHTFHNEKLYKEIVKSLPAPRIEDSLAALYPDVAKEWDFENNKPLIPTLFRPSSNYNAHWVCNNNPEHRWKTAIGNRTQYLTATNCPLCAHAIRGRKRKNASIMKHGNILQTAPELAMEWDYEKNGESQPEDFSVQSNDYVWWKCSQGHSWRQQVILRFRKKYGCLICSKEKRSIVLMSHHAKNKGSIATQPIVTNWDYEKNMPYQPDGVSLGFRKLLWWICPRCKQSWQSTINTATRRNAICSQCMKSQK
jgi:hypothetical protein